MMKKTTRLTRLQLLSCLLIMLSVFSCKKETDDTVPNSGEATSSIDLKITNIQDIEGQLWVALYNNETDWDADIKDSELTQNEFLLISKIVSETEHTVEFDDIPAGNYAISMFHDLNSSGELEKGGLFNAFPQEPYGFSNNFKPTLSAPNFSDCSFTVEKDQSLQIEIDLIEP